MVEIEHVLASQRVTMHSCTRCETRWWDRDGAPVALESVLSVASAR